MNLCYHCMKQLPSDTVRFCPQCGKSVEPLPVPDRFLKPGTVLGGKVVVGYPLGAGGFGNTYIGWDSVLFRKVAVKEFYPKQYCKRGEDGVSVTVADERFRARFARGLQQFLTEARNVAALHEVQGVVEISNFFQQNETGYIIMEYLEGMDVRNILKNSGNQKDYAWCRRVILTVLYTLKEIHKRGVLHRDIAPDNVFVTREGVIKLIDFGAAKQASVLENTSDIMLKAGYAPIEQYDRAFIQGSYTDIYAVAAMFYRMLTGQKPLPANERLEKEALILPSEMGVKLPEKAELAIMVCLNLQPEYRLQSAAEFMEALDGADFVPSYEPEWILPSPEEKKGLWSKIRELPIAARAGLCVAGICLTGLLVFGTVTLVSNRGKEVVLDSDVIVMEDLRGQSQEDAAAFIDKLNRSRANWDIQAEISGTVFDLTKENGTICTQSVAPGTVLYDERFGGEAEGLRYDSAGGVSGEVSFTVYSHDQILCREICEGNAYTLAKKLGIDPADTERFIEVNAEADENSYFDLAYVEVEGEKFSAKELQKEANEEKAIAYSDDIKVYYYASEFFYWEELPDFAKEYETLDQIPKQAVYKLQNEKERVEKGKRSLLDSSLVNDQFAALEDSGYEEGSIIGQSVPAGEEYDETKQEGEKLLNVVGTILEYKGKTGEEFAEILKEYGFGVYGFQTASGSAGKGTWEIAKVELYKADEENVRTEETLSYVEISPTGDNKDVFFVITVKEPPAPAPAPAPTPAPAPEPPNSRNAMHSLVMSAPSCKF